MRARRQPSATGGVTVEAPSTTPRRVSRPLGPSGPKLVGSTPTGSTPSRSRHRSSPTPALDTGIGTGATLTRTPATPQLLTQRQRQRLASDKRWTRTYRTAGSTQASPIATTRPRPCPTDTTHTAGFAPTRRTPRRLRPRRIVSGLQPGNQRVSPALDLPAAALEKLQDSRARIGRVAI